MPPVLSKQCLYQNYYVKQTKEAGVPDGGHLMRAPNLMIWSEGIVSISILIDEQAAIANKYIEPQDTSWIRRSFIN